MVEWYLNKITVDEISFFDWSGWYCKNLKKNLKFGAFKREFPLNELARLSLERVQWTGNVCVG